MKLAVAEVTTILHESNAWSNNVKITKTDCRSTCDNRTDDDVDQYDENNNNQQKHKQIKTCAICNSSINWHQNTSSTKKHTYTQHPSLSQNSCVWYTCVSAGTLPQSHDSQSAPAMMQTPGCWISSDYILHQKQITKTSQSPILPQWGWLKVCTTYANACGNISALTVSAPGLTGVGQTSAGVLAPCHNTDICSCAIFVAIVALTVIDMTIFMVLWSWHSHSTCYIFVIPVWKN